MTTSPRAAYLACISLSQGKEWRQGSHQEAQKSTRITLPRRLARSSGSFAPAAAAVSARQPRMSANTIRGIATVVIRFFRMASLTNTPAVGRERRGESIGGSLQPLQCRQQEFELGGREQRGEALLVPGDPRLRLAQRVLTSGCQVELLAAAVVGRTLANDQTALFVAVDDRHHRCTIDIEGRSHRYLRDAGVAVDQPQRCSLLLREAQVGERRDEIPMHRDFRAPQPIAEEAVELFAHHAWIVELLRRLLRFSARIARHRRSLAAAAAALLAI